MRSHAIREHAERPVNRWYGSAHMPAPDIPNLAPWNFMGIVCNKHLLPRLERKCLLDYACMSEAPFHRRFTIPKIAKWGRFDGNPSDAVDGLEKGSLVNAWWWWGDDWQRNKATPQIKMAKLTTILSLSVFLSLTLIGKKENLCLHNPPLTVCSVECLCINRGT